ncbi:MAG: acyl-CoA dehydrogenase FadE [Moritella sp.]|uniref:acyl-CoA dehydrogenase FadE n=1 Tax=Moritella sp. TaxID=78556 RepID=UPI0021712AE4|nr:acyl-CoA dehydrogenase FadE [Moritella sp.]MBL1417682.1 acyl-CoA dehydrogenase FadE [Moritella sp.]
MATTISLLALVAIFGTLSYQRASLAAFTGAFFIALAAVSYFGDVPLAIWIITAVIAIPLNITSIRQSYLTAPILKGFRKIMPEMSQTETEALEAGTTWWDADLFSGKPNWEKLHNVPAPALTAEERAFLDGPVEEACRMADEFDITHNRADLPPELWEFLKTKGFFAMIIKKKYGGLEFSALAQSMVLQKLTGSSAVMASTVGVPNSLGPGELLQHYGTKEQQDYYLPRLAAGDEIPCFALTSPEAGSDAGAIPDFGIICKGEFEGKEVLGMKLTWNKRYITLAPIATVLGLAIKLRDPDGLIGDKVDIGITCALIPTDIPGVETGRRHFPLNLPFQNGPTKGNEVFVPLDYIIGGPEMAGQGWRMLVECLSVGRGITLPSCSAGAVKMAALGLGSYTAIRRQFKVAIGKMEGIEEPLARIGGNAYLMGAASTLTTSAIDLGEKPSVITAIIKMHLTDRAQKCAIDAMDISGGKGICLGPNNMAGRGYQAAPIAITVEGANILTRNLIIYGQGAIRCHPFVLAELNAAALDDQNKGLQDFDAALFGHVGFAMSNFFRSFVMGITNGKGSAAPFKDETAQYYQQMNRLSANLAFLSDVAMGVLGGELKRKERVSARLGDILSQLYLSSATLKRFEDEGRQKDDLPFVHWALQDSLFKAEQAIDELLRNFPVRVVGIALRAMVLPTGTRLSRPTDKLDHVVAGLLQVPSEARSRLATDMYLTEEEGNPVGLQEKALRDIIVAEPIFIRVCKENGVRLPLIYLDKFADEALANKQITADEAELLKVAEEGRLRTINVDDFDPEVLAADKSLVNQLNGDWRARANGTAKPVKKKKVKTEAVA